MPRYNPYSSLYHSLLASIPWNIKLPTYLVTVRKLRVDRCLLLGGSLINAPNLLTKGAYNIQAIFKYGRNVYLATSWSLYAHFRGKSARRTQI